MADAGHHVEACARWISEIDPDRVLVVDAAAGCPRHGMDPAWWLSDTWESYQVRIDAAHDVAVWTAFWSRHFVVPRLTKLLPPAAVPPPKRRLRPVTSTIDGPLTYSPRFGIATLTWPPCLWPSPPDISYPRRTQPPDRSGPPKPVNHQVGSPLPDPADWHRYAQPTPTVRPTVHVPGDQDSLIARCERVSGLDPRQLVMASAYAGWSRRDAKQDGCPGLHRDDRLHVGESAAGLRSIRQARA